MCSYIKYFTYNIFYIFTLLFEKIYVYSYNCAYYKEIKVLGIIILKKLNNTLFKRTSYTYKYIYLFR